LYTLINFKIVKCYYIYRD